MSEFGEISGYETKKYSIEVPASSSPQLLIVAAMGSETRDFVLLPHKGLLASYPKLASMTFSASLDARYCYIGGDLTYVELSSESNNLGSKSTMEFVIARWARKSLVAFPKNIKCIANVRASAHGPAKHYNEILSASAVSMP